MSSSNKLFSYTPELDGIRGLAIIAVMIFHTGIPFFKGGFIGVDIFFVLSGFLITVLLFNEYDAHNKVNLKYFYIRRILRLAPALFLLLSIITLLSCFTSIDPDKANIKSIIIALFYSSNWVRAFHLHEMGLLNHTWSLSIEEQFYILWPVLLIILLKTIRSVKTIIFITILFALTSWALRILFVISGAPAERIYNGLDTRADALLTGCILGLMYSANLINQKKDRTRLILKYLAYAALLCFSIMIISISWRNFHMYYWGDALVQFLSAMLILHVFVSRSSIIKKLLAFRPLVWIGSISYGLYLWHDPVYELMRAYGYSQITIALIGSLLTFSIASLSYYIVEQPVLKLKSKLINRSAKRNSEFEVIKKKGNKEKGVIQKILGDNPLKVL